MFNIQFSQKFSFLGIIHQDKSFKVLDNKFHQTFARMLDHNLLKENKVFCLFQFKNRPPDNLNELFKVWVIASRSLLENVGLYAKVTKVALFMCCLLSYIYGILKATVYFLSLYKNILDYKIFIFSKGLFQLSSSLLKLNFQLFFVAPIAFGIFKLLLTIVLIASLKLVIEDPYDFKRNLKKFFKNMSSDVLYGKIIYKKLHPKEIMPRTFLNPSIDDNLMDPLNLEKIPKAQIEAARYVALPNLILTLKSIIWLYMALNDHERIHPVEKQRELSSLEKASCLESLMHFFSATQEELKSISDLKIDHSFQSYFQDKFLMCEKLYKLYVFYKEITLSNPAFYPLDIMDERMLVKIKELPFESKRILLRLMPDIESSDLI